MATKRKTKPEFDDGGIEKLDTLHHRKELVKWDGPALREMIWTPQVHTAFKLLLAMRLTSAIWSNISDCDETFNYWEPAHFLLYGKGFQTWEYSPVYAIRSYSYIYLNMAPAWIIQVCASAEKVTMFYIIRIFLGSCCAISEVYFYRGVVKHFGAAVGRLTLAFLLLSTGMYISAAAFLPSSFSMYMVLISMAAWLQGHLPVAITAVAASTFLGWPFAAVLGLPIAIDVLLRRRLIKTFIMWCTISLGFILGPTIYVDSEKFGKLVIASLNIVKYNVLSDHGPDLYGKEPWTFYFVNGFLNFNVVFIAALPAAALLLINRLTSKLQFPGIPHWLTLMPLYLWIAIFFTQPHKEERFLFPIYPLFCLAAALSMDCLQRLGSQLFLSAKSHYTDFLPSFQILFVVVTGLLSLSRALALYTGYHAPLDVYGALYTNISSDQSIHTLAPNKPVIVCVGKEWYRFPTNFFLPNNKWSLKFVQSEFRGQLPAEYLSGGDATSKIPDNMNDWNREETSRYVNVSQCHYMIDLDVGTVSQKEPNYSRQTDRWKVVYSAKFLNTAETHPVLRAFYIPWLSESRCTYGNYNILKATNSKKSRSP